MRTKLATIKEKKIKVRSTVIKFSKTSNHPHAKQTICFKNVIRTDLEEYLTDHAWAVITKTINKANLDRGDIVEFSAIIRPYRKSNNLLDFKLSYISDIKKINIDFKLNRSKNLEDPRWRRYKLRENTRSEMYNNLIVGDDSYLLNNKKIDIEDIPTQKTKNTTCPNCKEYSAMIINIKNGYTVCPKCNSPFIYLLK